MTNIFWVIFLIFAGQTIGALVGLIGKPKEKFINTSLAFAASMMISLSLFELIPQALEFSSKPLVMLGFFVGIVIFLLIDKLLPHINPELMQSETPNVKRSVWMLVIGIGLHNIPEGLAIGVGFRNNELSGIMIALGIALQDIPENIATIIPLFAFTGNRLKSFLIMFTTVLFEFIGFLIGFFIFYGSSKFVLSISLAAAAGFMSYISVEELLPEAFDTKAKKFSYFGFFFGSVVVLFLLWIF